jgi:AraC family transcriptional regulator of arabinose operon
MMLFRPEAEYHYGLHPLAEHWEHYWALFQPRGHWAELLNWHRLDSNILLLPLPDAKSTETIKHLFNELQAMSKDTYPFQSELKHNKLEELLIRARSFLATESQVTIDARILRVCDLMQARLADKFSVNDIALACNLSPSRLSHLFKQEMGIGAKSWINNQRLQKARMLLLESNESIRHIGAQVGYEDAAHFTRHFRKNVGCSPRQFRKNFIGPG